jgi:hypothetical protein
LNLDDCGKGPCLEHGVPRSDVWEHGRSEDRDSQHWLAAPISREARLIPEGIGVTREGWLASGWRGPTIEGDSRPHGRWAPERSPLRSGQPRSSCLSWKRALGLDPEVVAPDRFCGSRQHHRSSDAGGARPAPSGTSSGGNGFQVGQLGSSVFRVRPARRRSSSTLVATRRHYDQVCVFDAPEGAPHRIAPTAFCLICSVRRRIAHRRDAWSGSEPGKPPPEGRGPPKRSGAALAAEAASPP